MHSCGKQHFLGTAPTLTALLRCLAEDILWALLELCENPHWVYIFNTLLSAHKGSSSSGTSCTPMHSCLAQLTQAETLSAEVIKALEGFLGVPKVKHPMSATFAQRTI